MMHPKTTRPVAKRVRSAVLVAAVGAWPLSVARAETTAPEVSPPATTNLVTPITQVIGSPTFFCSKKDENETIGNVFFCSYA